MGKIIQDSIAGSPHLVAMDDLANARYSALDLDAVLIYLIDIVSETALEHLADQFDVLGSKGYRQAQNDQERRDIIKSAIELKRYVGTVWAIEEAMRSVGYGNAQLVENAGTGPTGWAQFRVVADLGEDKGLSDDSAIQLTSLINKYKNVRSHLLDISYTMTASDLFPSMNEEFVVDFYADDLTDSIELGVPFLLNGTYQLNSSVRLDDDQDEVFSLIIQ